MQAPDYLGTMIGYRSWVPSRKYRLENSGEGLFSPMVTGSYRWEAVNKASCNYNRSHQAPNPGCGCGFYAMRAPGLVPSQYPVVGAVEAWGRIEVHKDGMRAEYMRPIAISCAPLAKNLNPLVLIANLSLFFLIILGLIFFRYSLAAFAVGLITLPYLASWFFLVEDFEPRFNDWLKARRQVKRIARVYQIPKVPYRKLERYACERGHQIPELLDLDL